MKRRAIHPVPSRSRGPEGRKSSPSPTPAAVARRSPAEGATGASAPAPSDPVARAARLGHHIRSVPLGAAPVQRVFTYMGAPLAEPFSVLRYLLDTRRIARDDAETIGDFHAKAAEDELVRQEGSSKRKRTVQFHSLNDWLAEHHLGRAGDVLRAAHEHAGQRTQPPKRVPDSENETILNTPLGDGRGDRTVTPENQKKRRRVDKERPADHPILVITWNLEKYGRTSDKEKKRLKREAILKIVDLYHPSVFVMQEVTDAGLLFEGRSVGRGEGVPLGGGIGFANLHQLINPGLGELALPRRKDEENPLDPRDTGLISHYPLQEEYGLLQGPLYSADPYQEYYPLLYEKARVRGVPQSFFIRDGKNGYSLEDVPEGHEEPFSSKEAITRELLVWRVPIQTGGYTFRPSTLEETGREVPTQNVYVCVVHTSPSNQVGIREETEEILRKATWLRGQTKSPVILAGDWYMEKKNPELFRDLQEGEREGWSLAASELGLQDVPLPERIAPPPQAKKGKKGKKGKGKGTAAPKRERPRFHQTNFPHKGQGQVADHFVISEDLRVPLTSVIPATDLQEGWLEGQGKPTIDEEEDLHSWTESGADHVPVLTVVYATVTNSPRPARSGPEVSTSSSESEEESEPSPVRSTSSPKGSASAAPAKGGLRSLLDDPRARRGGPSASRKNRKPVPSPAKGKPGGSGKPSPAKGGALGSPGRTAEAYVSAAAGRQAILHGIDGRGLDCYIRSIVTGLTLQGLPPKSGWSIERIVTAIRRSLSVPNGPLNAGGPEALGVRSYIARNSRTWFGVANVQARANVVQVGQGDWEAQHWESTGVGTHDVWLRYTTGGIGHFDLLRF